MTDEQIRLVWKDAAESLFRLRIQAQTERLDAPSEMRSTARRSPAVRPSSISGARSCRRRAAGMPVTG